MENQGGQCNFSADPFMSTISQFFASESWQKLRNLRLPAHGGMLGGVCIALGEATPIAAWMWRVAFLALAYIWGFGALIYLALWLAIPAAGHLEKP